MYPPRKNDSGSKPKNNQGTFSSPPHKDMNKINKLLQNAKKYEQTKDYKRDYLLQGMMNMKKKQPENEGLGTKNRESEISSSQKQEENKKDIYRRVESSDRNRGQRGQNNKQQQQSAERQVKRLSNYKSADNLHTYQSDTYRNQASMARESDKPFQWKTSTQQLGKHDQVNNYSSINSNNKISTGNTQAYIGNKVTEQSNIQNYNFRNEANKNIENKLEQNIHSPRNNQGTSNNQNYQQVAPNYQMVSNNQVGSNYQREGKKLQINSNGHGKGQNMPEQSKSMTNTMNMNSNKINSVQYRNNGQVNQQLSQKGMNQFVSQYNNSKTMEEKRQLATKNFHDQNYLRRLESGEIEQEQRNNIKEQMQKLISQATQYRDKYYKTENERSILHEKWRIFQNEAHELRKENQQIKFKLKNAEFQIDSLRHYKQHASNEIRDLKTTKEGVYLDLSGKVNQLAYQIRTKTSEISRLQRQCMDYEEQLSKKKYQLERLQGQNGRREQTINSLRKKLNEMSSLYEINNKIDFELKSTLLKLNMVEAQNKKLRERNLGDQRSETDGSNYRRQIQQMLQDMKDLQMQLEEKDAVINQYKNYSFKQSQNSQVRHVQIQLQKVLKEKNQMSRTYEQRLLQKDKKISQLQIQQFEKKSLQVPRLGGIEAGEASFQEILKQQLQEVNSLKRQLTTKVGEMFHLKIQLQNMRSELQNQKNKFRILSMQLEVNQKNSQASNDPHLRAAKNQIDSLNRRIQILNQTIEARRKQNQNKDQFIKKYIVAVNKQTNPTVLISNLEKILTQKP